MTVLDFNVPFCGLDGTPHESITLGGSLAQQLGVKSEPIKDRKAVGYAKALTRGEALQVDDSDFDDLKEFISKCTEFTNLYRVALLDLLDGAKK